MYAITDALDGQEDVCLNCHDDIEWNQGQDMWLHNHTSSPFCGDGTDPDEDLGQEFEDSLEHWEATHE